MADSSVRTQCWKTSYLPPNSAVLIVIPKAALSAPAVGDDKFPKSCSNHRPREIFGIAKSGMVKAGTHQQGKAGGELHSPHFHHFPPHPRGDGGKNSRLQHCHAEIAFFFVLFPQFNGKSIGLF